jgi:small GTP-binding protein
MVKLPRLTLPVTVTIAGLLASGQYIEGLTHLHSAIAPYSIPLAHTLVVTLLGLTAGSGIAGFVWFRSTKPLFKAQQPPKSVETPLEDLIAQVEHDITRRALEAERDRITSQLESQQFHLVIFGTSSAGKTSLVNALLGRWVGETSVTLGTTQEGSAYTYTIEGVSGPILLTDTPGLHTIEGSGEAEAKQLARQADLLIFVVAGDLLASEYEELIYLAKLGKRAILALNKTDQILPEDADIILSHLRHQTEGVIPSQHVVTIAADPQPLKVKHLFSDGSETIEYEPQEPDTQSLVIQIAAILEAEGHHLRLANALLRSQTLAESAQEALHTQREEQAKSIIGRMQWATAGAVAVTPLPALDMIAAVAINARMILDIHQLYGESISFQRAKEIAQSLGQLLLKLGGVELATQSIGSLLKASPLALVGIPLQAVSAAYLTRIAGFTYLEWMQAGGGSWKEEEIKTYLEKQLRHHRQPTLVQTFLQPLIQRSN